MGRGPSHFSSRVPAKRCPLSLVRGRGRGAPGAELGASRREGLHSNQEDEKRQDQFAKFVGVLFGMRSCHGAGGRCPGNKRGINSMEGPSSGGAAPGIKRERKLTRLGLGGDPAKVPTRRAYERVGGVRLGRLGPQLASDGQCSANDRTLSTMAASGRKNISSDCAQGPAPRARTTISKHPSCVGFAHNLTLVFPKLLR